MTAPRRTAARRLALAAALAVASAPGCKSKEGSTGGGSGTRPDPLVAGPGRIPRQNIPLPDKGGTAGGRKGSDPLLGSPVARPGERSGYTTDPERWKGGPYVPGRAGTPASLAAREKGDGLGLRIESANGTPLTPTGGTAAAATEVPPDLAPLYAQLEGYKVKRGDYTVVREGNRILFQARVPLDSGGVRGYTGAGATEADAVRQVLDQIRLDRGTR